MEIVVSLPHGLRAAVGEKITALRSTEEAFRTLIGEARQLIRIFSPYVDPTFTSLVAETRAPVRVVTTVRERRIKSNPVLERCSMVQPVSVRYLHAKKAGSQIYQLHAKMILADRTAAYVGSANLTDTSLRYNLELGLLVRDAEVVRELGAFFDYVFDRVATPAGA